MVDLSEDEPEIVAAMVQFFYTAQYSEKTCTSNPAAHCLLHHVQLYCLADRFSITLLKSLITHHLDLIFSQDENIWDIQDLASATKYAYENTAPNDNTMKDILIPLIIQEMRLSFNEESGPISRLMLELAEVGHDVARALRHVDFSSVRPRRSHLEKTMFSCNDGCGHSWLIGEEERSDTWKVTCPCCDTEMGKKKENRSSELLHAYKCQMCHEVILSSWTINDGEIWQLFCNCCANDFTADD